MTHQKLLREITPLTESDCFMLFARKKDKFDFPLHYHEEFELNFIRNARGARRVVGDHTGEIDDLELVLVASNIPHGWFTHRCTSGQIEEITIQFHKDFLDAVFLKRNQLSFLKRMFEEAARGILFSRQTTEQLASRIVGLDRRQGFGSVLEFMSILHDLSISRNMRMLSDVPSGHARENILYDDRNIRKAMQFIQERFADPITVEEVAALTGIPAGPFGRFFKRHTGNTFKEVLNEVRLGNASRMLIDTSRSVNEIAYNCGFNNLSYFNRLFKLKKHCTPKEFREKFSGTRIFI
jgi:AraC-like DNA-binding protein